MESICQKTRDFFGPITSEQLREADTGSYWRRVGNKGLIGVRAEILAVPLFIIAYLGSELWLPESIKANQSAFRSVVVAPLSEEIAFRGILQPLLIGSIHRLMDGSEESRPLAEKVGIVGAALIFGGFHGFRAQSVGATFGGLLYGYLRVRCEHKSDEESGWQGWLAAPFHFFENIAPCIAGHALHNCVVAVLAAVA